MLAVAALLAGCGLRLDSPDPTPSPPSADEVARQREALRAEALARLPHGGEEALVAVALHAGQQLDALGGVWVAWPAGDGPSPTDAPAADIVIGPGATGVLEALDEGIPDLVAATREAEDPALARLFAAIATARTADAERLATAVGVPRDIPPMPSVITATVPEVVRSLDATAWLIEAIAARRRAAGEDAGALIERAAELRRLAEATVTANGWVDADPRDPWYPVSEADDAAGLEANLARALVAAIGESAARESLLAAARTSAVLAARGGAEVGALPGVG